MTRLRAAGPFTLKRVLVLCDLSLASTNAAWRAGLLARDHGAWLRILHVGRQASRVRQAQAALDALAWELQERLRIAVLAQSVRGDLGREAVAAAGEADLLVVRTAQAHPLRDWLAGFHPERLAQACQVPTLVVRRPASVGYRRVLASVDYDGEAAARVAAGTAMTRAARREMAVHAGDPTTVVFDHDADMLLAKERSVLADLVVIGRRPRAAPALWAPRTSSRTVLAGALADVLVLPAMDPEPLPSSAGPGVPVG